MQETFKIGDVFSRNANHLVIKGFMDGDVVELAYCDKDGDYKNHPSGNAGVYYPLKALIRDWRKV